METTIKNKSLWIAAALVLFGASLRLLPHPANFAPVGAIALFGGMMLPKRIGWWLPVAVMAISDMHLGYYSSMPFTWAAFLLISLIGMAYSRWQSWLRVPFGTLAASLTFFMVSNFGVWLAGGLYAHTLSGLWQCYLMAVPFFRATLLSDALYSVILFGAYALATLRVSQRAANRAQQPSV